MKFSERYRKDNDMITAPKKAFDQNNNSARSRSVGFSRWAAIAACTVLAAAIAVPTVTHFAKSSKTPSEPDDAFSSIEPVIPAAKSYDDIYELILPSFQAIDEEGVINAAVFTTSSTVAEAAQADGAADLDDSKSAEPVALEQNSGTGSYSTTNNQVENVDEADFIKTDGEYIYRVRSKSLCIARASDLKLMSSATLDLDENCWAQEMFVNGDRLAVLFNGCISAGYVEKNDIKQERWESVTGLLVYDISDRSAPKLVNDLSLSGNLSTSRMINDVIYLITTYNVYETPDKDNPETFVPCVYCKGECAPVAANDIYIGSCPSSYCVQYTVVSSVKIADGSKFDETKALLGNAGTVYCSLDKLIIASSEYSEESVDSVVDGKNVTTITGSSTTALTAFAIKDGSIKQSAAATIPGTLLNQFSLDDHNGVLRLVTTCYQNITTIYTDGIDSYEYDNSQTNALYTFDSSLKQLGCIEDLAPDERIYSARFDGDIAYFVTFRQVDPLFAVDVSDPAKPVVLSALKIPGFSSYLHKYDDGLLFGLGEDADEETGRVGSMKLTMFDVTSPADVAEKHTLILDSYSSEALYNHKAILVSKERDIIAFPADDKYVVYGYDPDSGFYKRAELKPEGDWSWGTRGLYIDDCFFICGNQKISKFSMNDFSLIGAVELPAEEIATEVTTVGAYALKD